MLNITNSLNSSRLPSRHKTVNSSKRFQTFGLLLILPRLYEAGKKLMACLTSVSLIGCVHTAGPETQMSHSHGMTSDTNVKRMTQEINAKYCFYLLFLFQLLQCDVNQWQLCVNSTTGCNAVNHACI